MQGTRVQVKTTKRTGTIESGIPFRVGNKKYVEVRWDDDGKTSNIGVWLLARVK
jgi:hypothetical protein